MLEGHIVFVSGPSGNVALPDQVESFIFHGRSKGVSALNNGVDDGLVNSLWCAP